MIGIIEVYPSYVSKILLLLVSQYLVDLIDIGDLLTTRILFKLDLFRLLFLLFVI